MVPRFGASAPAPDGGARLGFFDDDEDQITAVHTDDLEPRRPLGRPAPEGTVRLPSAQLRPSRDEQTMLLAPDERSSRAAEDDGGWATVVLPGGGHPDHVADRTQLLPLGDEPEPVEERGGRGGERASASAPARSITVPSLSASARSITVPSLSASAPAPGVAIEGPVLGPAASPGAWAGPTGGYPAVGTLPTGGHPTMGTPSGGYPAVGMPTGAHPAAGSGRARAGARQAPRGGGGPRTSAHAPVGPRRAGDDNTRLAWGFLAGVLLTVAIVGGAVVLALLVLRQ